MKEKYYKVAKTITPWKLDNKFENWLGYKAEKSEFWKMLYLYYYRIKNPKYFKKGLRLAKEELNCQSINFCPIFGGRVLSEKVILTKNLLL